MHLIWATEEFKISGRAYPGFPIILWEDMNSCLPVNEFIRYYLLRGAIGSSNSWASTGRALYDFFSFLQAHDLCWKDVDQGHGKNLVAAYRDYCLNVVKLAVETVRQRLSYICSFYEFAKRKGEVENLPFELEERIVGRRSGFLSHLDSSGGRMMSNNMLPRVFKRLPKYLTQDEVNKILSSVENPHHQIIIKFGLLTGLRREEIATFPIKYVLDLNLEETKSRNVSIRLDPFDGTGMKTKGKKPRSIYIPTKFLMDIKRYIVQLRGERSSLSNDEYNNLFLNQYGIPFNNGGKGIERIVRESGRKLNINVHTHMLRHTYATHTLYKLQKNGYKVDHLIFLQRQLGHSSITTTMIYLHLIHEFADQAVLDYSDELNEILDIEHA